jgi:hypothetical protein
MQTRKISWAHGLAVIVIAVASCHQVKSEDCSLGFQQGAEQFVQVQYRTKTRKGVGKQIVTEAEVLWQPQQMLANPTCYDLKQTTLLYKPVRTKPEI